MKRLGGASLRVVIALSVCGLSVACGEPTRDTSDWTASVDTLPNGTILVSNPASGMLEGDGEWRIVEELRIGRVEGDGPDVFGEIADVALGLNGEIYVLEAQALEIRVFSSNGRHLRTFGGSGGGPGELGRPIGLAIDQSGSVWVPDIGNGRYSVFDSTGSYISSHPRHAGVIFPWLGSFDDGGYLVDLSPDFPVDGAGRVVFLRLDPNTGDTDTLTALPYPRPLGDRPVLIQLAELLPQTTLAVGPRAIWFANTAEYRIFKQSFDGDTVRVFGRTYDPVPVDSEDRDSVLAAYAVVPFHLDPSDIPHTRPPVRRIHVNTDGRVIVRLFTHREDEGLLFDLFDAESRYLAALRSDVRLAHFPPARFRGDEVLGVTTDEAGVPYVTMGRIVKRPGS